MTSKSAKSLRVASSFGLVCLLTFMMLAAAGPAHAAEVCFAVADSFGPLNDGKAEDLLTRVDRSDPNPATNEVNIGSGTGTFNIEGATFQPGTSILFAANRNRLGILSLSTGKFTARASPFGNGSGSAGSITFNDVDGVTFDPSNGFLYATERRGEGSPPDVLFRVDPATGARIPNAFGAGADYVVIAPVSGLNDIDDITVDPANGQIYGIANNAGRSDRLVKINKASGATSDVGALKVNDMEGLSFAPDGTLLGTTGKVSQQGEALWDINTATGVAGNKRPLDNGTDYEAVACLVSAPPPPPPSGTIMIVKNAVPDDPQDFNFTATGLSPATFALDDDPGSATPNSKSFTGLGAGTFAVTEQAVAAWNLTSLVCTDPSGGTTVDLAARKASIDLAAGEAVTCTFTNTKQATPPGPAIHIEKSGPALVHVGDTITYTFEVTNASSVPLGNITLTDPRCDSAPTLVSKTGGDQDALLEVGEVWNFTCTHVVTSSDPDPVPNTATVAGTDNQGTTVTDQDSHSVDVIHPAISIIKTATPASGAPGTTVTFSFLVTNTGDTTLFDVSVDDDKLGHIGDVASLAPGQSVTLTKTSTLGGSSATNVGTAVGSDSLGKKVQARDDATVITVLPARLVPPAGQLPETGRGAPAALAVAAISLIYAGALLLGRERRLWPAPAGSTSAAGLVVLVQGLRLQSDGGLPLSPPAPKETVGTALEKVMKFFRRVGPGRRSVR